MANANDLVVLETAPRQVEGIVLRFDPRRGAVVDFFPETTAFTDEALALAKQAPGVMWVEGEPKIGTRVTFTVANGDALYELTHRVRVANQRGYEAALKSYKLRVAGNPAVVKTYNALAEFTDEWPSYAAFTDAFLRSYPHVMRIGTFVTVQADGVSAEYQLILPHPRRRDAQVAERLKLQTPTGTTITLPVASAKSLLVS